MVLVAGITLLIGATGSALAQGWSGAYGGGMMDSGWGMFGGGLFVWPLLVLGLIALAIYWAGSQREDSNSEQPDPARVELRERYARGEITDEEFEERLQMLRDNR